MRTWMSRVRHQHSKILGNRSDRFDDTQPSPDLAQAVRLLQRGRSIPAIAKSTGLPQALVELLAESSGTRHRVTPRIVATVVLIAITNIAVDLYAAARHDRALGTASALTALALVFTGFRIARRSRPHH